MGKLYSVKEVASILNVSVSAVRKWILEKKINYKKIGKLIRFTDEDVENFVNGRNQKSQGKVY